MKRRIPPLVEIDTEKRTAAWHKGPVAEGTLVICMDYAVPLIQPDNLTGQCAECSRAIQFRPGHPPGVRRICTRCVAIIAATEGTTPQ